MASFKDKLNKQRFLVGAASIAIAATAALPALAGSDFPNRPPIDTGGGGRDRGGDLNGGHQVQPPVYVPPQVQPPHLPPILPVPPPTGAKNPVFVPTDVTNPAQTLGNLSFPGINLPTAMSGLIPLKINDFPKEDDSKDNGEWVLVRAEQDARYTRPSPISVELSVGAVLVSVRRPSQTAFVKTELGKVAIMANGDAIIKDSDEVIRVMNVDGLGKSVRIKLEGGPFVGSDSKVVALKPGFELVAGKRLLKRTDLKPKDGIGRRKASVVLKGYAAVNQFSVDTLMQSCDLVVAINQKVTGVKERRILSDMSKMAAVINMMDGAPGQGFVRETNYKLAQTEDKKTQ